MAMLYPFGSLDVLGFYRKISEYLMDFLEGREIASKTWIPGAKTPFFLNRAGKMGSLWIKDFEEIDDEFLRLRAEHHLKDVRERLSDRQVLLWKYFVPRKLSEFFYSTNREKKGGPIDRVFIDIDRTNLPPERSLEVARLLVEIMDDWRSERDEFMEIVKDVAVYWTGSSFHIYLFLKSPRPPDFYGSKLHYHRENVLFPSWTDEWVNEIKKKVDFRVEGGHEKIRDTIIVDPSQTPSGKLGRVPLGSLHVKNFQVDGVSIPLNRKMLYGEDTVEYLQALSPETVVEKARELSRYIFSLDG